MTVRDGAEATTAYTCPDLWHAVVLAVVVRRFWPSLRVAISRRVRAQSLTPASSAAVCGTALTVGVSALARSALALAPLTLARPDRPASAHARPETGPMSAPALTSDDRERPADVALTSKHGTTDSNAVRRAPSAAGKKRR